MDREEMIRQDTAMARKQAKQALKEMFLKCVLHSVIFISCPFIPSGPLSGQLPVSRVSVGGNFATTSETLRARVECTLIDASPKSIIG